MKQKIIIYDFDGTLTPYTMPKFEIIEKCGIENYFHNPIFLNTVKNKIKEKNIDTYTANYEAYLETISKNNLKLIDENFCLGADNVEYNNGVIDFLKLLVNNNVKNYILSSGIKVFLENTIVAPLFSKIYGTTFSYNNENEATGIEYLMTDKNKVDALKEIVSENNLIDCSDVIYIGDGYTDMYAMEYITKNGGISIYVYQDEKEELENISKMKEKNIVNLFTKADYSYGSKLNEYIRRICNI